MDPVIIAEAKKTAVVLVQRLEPDEEDILEDGFDSLAALNFRVPKTVPEHAFQIPAETWSYAQTIGTFVGGIIAGAIKDALKDRLSKLLKRLLDKNPPLTEAEKQDLIESVESEGRLLRIPAEHRHRLQVDLRNL